MRAFVAMGFIVATTACGSAGQQFDTAHVRDIKRGQDEATIRRWFGDPLATENVKNGACSKRWVYYSAPSSVLFVNFDDNGHVCE